MGGDGRCPITPGADGPRRGGSPSGRPPVIVVIPWPPPMHWVASARPLALALHDGSGPLPVMRAPVAPKGCPSANRPAVDIGLGPVDAELVDAGQGPGRAKASLSSITSMSFRASPGALQRLARRLHRADAHDLRRAAGDRDAAELGEAAARPMGLGRNPRSRSGWHSPHRSKARTCRRSPSRPASKAGLQPRQGLQIGAGGGCSRPSPPADCLM